MLAVRENNEVNGFALEIELIVPKTESRSEVNKLNIGENKPPEEFNRVELVELVKPEINPVKHRGLIIGKLLLPLIRFDPLVDDLISCWQLAFPMRQKMKKSETISK